MNPNEAPSFELPPLGNNQSESTPEKLNGPSKEEVKTGVSPEQLRQANSAPQINTPAVKSGQMVPPSAQGTAVQSPPSSQATTAYLQADDVDLIEKEWVEKAKYVVERTQGDPYIQNREINKIKADYIKKRYNKDIKLSEE